MHFQISDRQLRLIRETEDRHAKEREEMEERHFQEMAELGILEWATRLFLKKAIRKW